MTAQLRQRSGAHATRSLRDLDDKARRRVGICIYIVAVTSSHPASREEIVEMIGEVDETFIDRIRETGATVDEVAEAIDELEGRFHGASHVPSSARVAEVRRVLDEVFSEG